MALLTCGLHLVWEKATDGCISVAFVIPLGNRSVDPCQYFTRSPVVTPHRAFLGRERRGVEIASRCNKCVSLHKGKIYNPKNIYLKIEKSLYTSQ